MAASRTRVCFSPRDKLNGSITSVLSVQRGGKGDVGGLGWGKSWCKRHARCGARARVMAEIEFERVMGVHRVEGIYEGRDRVLSVKVMERDSAASESFVLLTSFLGPTAESNQAFRHGGPDLVPTVIQFSSHFVMGMYIMCKKTPLFSATRRTCHSHLWWINIRTAIAIPKPRALSQHMGFNCPSNHRNGQSSEWSLISPQVMAGSFVSLLFGFHFRKLGLF